MKGAILVVEDHQSIREGMIQALTHAGFVGIPAANGQEALDYLRSGGEASVILLDLRMPVMNGWTFRQQQRDDPRLADIPTIVLSGFDSRPFEDDIPAALIGIFLQPDANALDVAKQIKQVMEAQAPHFPPDMVYSIPYSTTPFVTESLKEVTRSTHEEFTQGLSSWFRVFVARNVATPKDAEVRVFVVGCHYSDALLESRSWLATRLCTASGSFLKDHSRASTKRR